MCDYGGRAGRNYAEMQTTPFYAVLLIDILHYRHRSLLIAVVLIPFLSTMPPLSSPLLSPTLSPPWLSCYQHTWHGQGHLVYPSLLEMSHALDWLTSQQQRLGDTGGNGGGGGSGGGTVRVGDHTVAVAVEVLGVQNGFDDVDVQNQKLGYRQVTVHVRVRGMEHVCEVGLHLQALYDERRQVRENGGGQGREVLWYDGKFYEQMR